MSEGCVYTLVDPRTDEPRYVGATKIDPQVRLNLHLNQPTNDRMKKWVDELAESGLRPEMNPIRWADPDKLCDEEQELLDRLFDEYDLLNTQRTSRYTPHQRIFSARDNSEKREGPPIVGIEGPLLSYPKVRGRGQITIPENIRDRLAIEPGDTLRLEVENLDQ